MTPHAVIIIGVCASILLSAAVVVFAVLFCQTEENVCPYCGKGFDTRDELVYHLRWSKSCGGSGKIEDKV